MALSVAQAFRQLLSEKHLYQYVEVKLDSFSEAARSIQEEWEMGESTYLRGLGEPTAKERIDSERSRIISGAWLPSAVGVPVHNHASMVALIGFDLPTINTYCSECGERWPFNPVSEGSQWVQGIGEDECFYLGYQCQQCKGQPIRFLVCREGLKLRLAGRYPIEVLPTPKVLPKGVCKYFGDAQIAHHAGQTLAGLFLLRTFIEQFWRTVSAVQELVKAQPKATGDEQGGAYQSTLPDDFKSRFPSLTEVYDKLSDAIHSADANAPLFDESCAKIVKHFEARRIYELH